LEVVEEERDMQRRSHAGRRGGSYVGGKDLFKIEKKLFFTRRETLRGEIKERDGLDK